MANRISTSQLFHNAQSHVGQARGREVSSSEKAATLKELNRPSDNPSGWVQATQLKNEMQNGDTMAKNMSVANRMLAVTDNLLAQVTEGLDRAHEIAITAASDSVGGEQGRRIMLPEIKVVFDQIVQSLNFRYGGRTLLGGYQTQTPAYDEKGGRVGDENVAEIEIGHGMKMPINISPDEVIGGRGNGLGVDIIGTLKGLIAGLENDNLDQVRESLPQLLMAVDQISLGRSQVASKMLELERSMTNQSSEKIEQLESVSKIEEVDAVKAFSDLTRDQTVLRAAMSTSQKVLTEDPTAILFK